MSVQKRDLWGFDNEIIFSYCWLGAFRTVQVVSQNKSREGTSDPTQGIPANLLIFPFWSAWLPILLPPVSPDGRHLSAFWLLQLFLTELKPIPEIELPPLQRVCIASTRMKPSDSTACCLLSKMSLFDLSFSPADPQEELTIGLTCLEFSCWSLSYLNSFFLNFLNSIPLFSTLGHYYNLSRWINSDILNFKKF